MASSYARRKKYTIHKIQLIHIIHKIHTVQNLHTCSLISQSDPKTPEERSCKSGDEVWPEFTGEILLQVDTKLISIINHIYDASGAQIWMD
ncbi:hypothetical protein FXG21_20320 [Salmonella enterica]|nr:hypothetical protein [Salmonella enterica]